MASPLRRFTLLVALAALGFAVVGCSKHDKHAEEISLTQQQADDLTYALASMAAIDRGGWLVAIESTVNARPTSNLGTSAGVPLPGFLSRDTTFTRGDMSCTFSYIYYDTLNVARDTWDGSIRYLQGAYHTAGPMTLSTFTGSNGPATGLCAYAHTDTLLADGFRDSGDSLSFNGLSEVDSGLVSIHDGAGSRFYYLDNIVDFDLEVHKTASPPFPSSGVGEVSAFVDLLNSASRADKTRGIIPLDAVLTIFFDGTQTPLASITANSTLPTASYRYRIDLLTGAVERAP